MTMRRVESAGTHTQNPFENYADVQSRSSPWQFIGKIAPVRAFSLFELPPPVSFAMLACTRRNFRPWRRFTFTLRKELQPSFSFFCQPSECEQTNQEEGVGATGNV